VSAPLQTIQGLRSARCATRISLLKPTKGLHLVAPLEPRPKNLGQEQPIMLTSSEARISEMHLLPALMFAIFRHR